MHVNQTPGLIKRGDPDETQSAAPAIVAPQRKLAGLATIDIMRMAAIGGQRYDCRLAGEKLNPIGLDQRIDGKGAARLPLAVRTVAAMHEHRPGMQAISDTAAKALAVTNLGHDGCFPF